MSSRTLTLAADLASALAAEPDPWRRQLDLIAAVELIAEGLDGDDEGTLTDTAATLRAQLHADLQDVLDSGDRLIELHRNRYAGFADAMHAFDEHLRELWAQRNRIRALSGRAPDATPYEALPGVAA